MSRILSCLFLLAVFTSCSNKPIVAPNQQQPIISQHLVNKNACGPAAQLTAFRQGSPRWQDVYHSVRGETERDKLRTSIETWANKKSNHSNSIRWTPTNGTSPLDLTDIAREMTLAHDTPAIQYAILVKKSPQQNDYFLLKKIHQLLRSSLKKGLPPIITVRRYALLTYPNRRVAPWWPLTDHYIVVTSVPNSIPSNANSFPITYSDPEFGQSYQGFIQKHSKLNKHIPFLMADLPNAKVGKNKLRAGQKTLLAIPSAIGAW